ncbi:siderophore-interacting protein [Petropleomorpha daqingensis]|uniref:NADPH-dependent ferric siderophore reductase n=1 Tax=Petropleomorpha daqingensis TaxID=2026353 RepID=A0A853CFR6_9ACTN|nr:siderophore-interacting protein [Petropleomorpha daqingensis]NYJ06754.1 NADPH-dependent ferric siderophore reductase [Petropleomorpha daqingensis]
MTVQTVEAVPAYRPFAVTAVRVQRLTPSFVRVTFGGADLDEFASGGLDQRIKVLFPLPGRGLVDCPSGADWYGEWRALPPERRNPIRTYTVRAARPAEREVDVDFVVHDGATGPAGAWALAARPGDEVVLIGPNARFAGDTGGIEWRPPAGAHLLIAGDETAVPAICAIAEQLPADAVGQVFLEVPGNGDVLDVRAPAGVRLTWLPRDARARGELLAAAVTGAALPEPVLEDDDTAVLLWDVPPDDVLTARAERYVWLAGEAGVVTGLRRRLLADTGLDRAAVAVMGYWKAGRASV